MTLTGESAIDAAQAFLGTVNTREAAATFWLVAFAAFVVFHRSTRPSAVGVLKALAKPVLLAPLAIAALYAGAEIWALQRFGLWSATNLKTTILWLATFAFVTMFEVANAKERPASLGKITRDVVSVTAVLVFITGLHTFPLIVELIAFPLVTLIALTGEFAKHKPECSRRNAGRALFAALRRLRCDQARFWRRTLPAGLMVAELGSSDWPDRIRIGFRFDGNQLQLTRRLVLAIRCGKTANW